MEGHTGHMMPGHNMSSHMGSEMSSMASSDIPGQEALVESCSMNMFFNWQVKDLCIVFEWWHIHTPVELLLSCLAVFCIAAGYEYLRVWSNTLSERATLPEKKKTLNQATPSEHCEEGYEAVDGAGSSLLEKSTLRFSLRNAIKASIIYAILVALSFWLMLVFMTYNGYLMASTVLGAGFGHFVFGNGKLKAARNIQCH